MNDYATFQHHDKRYFDFSPQIIANFDATAEFISVIVFFTVHVRING